MIPSRFETTARTFGRLGRRIIVPCAIWLYTVRVSVQHTRVKAYITIYLHFIRCATPQKVRSRTCTWSEDDGDDDSDHRVRPVKVSPQVIMIRSARGPASQPVYTKSRGYRSDFCLFYSFIFHVVLRSEDYNNNYNNTCTRASAYALSKRNVGAKEDADAWNPCVPWWARALVLLYLESVIEKHTIRCARVLGRCTYCLRSSIYYMFFFF